MSLGSRLPSEAPGRAAPGDVPNGRGEARVLPDALRVAAARAAPANGPRILFLSGGTALRELSRSLTDYTHNSIHLVTPFDSGGSSAPLRAAFGMLAVGDLRNRLLALAPRPGTDPNGLHALLSARLARAGPREALDAELKRLASGSDRRLSRIPENARRLVMEEIGRFLRLAPDDFDLRGASIGNLVLTGLYLEGRDIHAALSHLAGLLGARGRVIPTVDANLHLAARLADGTRVVGQHRMTGKEHPPLASPVEELSLVESLDESVTPLSSRPAIGPEVVRLIRDADLICYPMGSFYTSVLCNLLPAGMGRAIASAPCPKVYVPSMGPDRELVGVEPGQTVGLLMDALRADAGPDTPADRLLNAVLLDPDATCYALRPDTARIERSGVEPLTTPLAARPGRPRAEPTRLAEILVSLARPPEGDEARR